MRQYLLSALYFSTVSFIDGFIPSTSTQPSISVPKIDRTSTTALFYEPKWKKKATLADQAPPKSFQEIGIKGNIPVVFRTMKDGNITQTKTTMGFAGQPLRDVAIQAGQFIKYGCGKGECGTCECLVNGQWIRPCLAVLPDTTGEYIVSVKATKSKAKSSGKFYSARSFVMGFWNNLLGMVGFVKYRRAAKANWQERIEYEELVRRLTLEKRAARLAREAAQTSKPQRSYAP
jgi:ferredoxin